MSGDPAGDPAPAEVAAAWRAHHRRRGTDDDGAVVDHRGAAARTPARAASGDSRTVFTRAGGLARTAVSRAAGWDGPAGLAARPRARPLGQVVPAPSAVALAAEGPGGRRAVDHEPLRPERRPGRHACFDCMEHGGAEMSGLSGRQHRGSILSPPVAGSGLGGQSVGHDKNPAGEVARRRYRDGRACLGGQRAAARSCGHPAGHPLVAGTAGQAARRLGGKSRRRAGGMVLRNMPTTFTRTATIRRRRCWR